MAKTFADDVLLDLQVTVDKVGAIDAVCHNTANKGSSEHDIFGTFGVEKRLNGSPVEQVEFGMGAPYQVGIAFALEVFPNGGTDEAAMACHINFSIFLHTAKSFYRGRVDGF